MSGTIKAITYDGVTYDVPADINITFNRNSFTKEGIATSGKTLIKTTRKVPTQEGVIHIITPAELEQLNALAERITSFPISVELADGSIYKTTGQINLDNYETEDGKANVMIIPDKTVNAWTPFVA